MTRKRRVIFALLVVAASLCIMVLNITLVFDTLNMVKEETVFDGEKEEIDFGYGWFWLEGAEFDENNVDFFASVFVNNHTDHDVYVSFRAIEIKSYLTGLLETPFMAAVDPQSGRPAVYRIAGGSEGWTKLTLRGASGNLYQKGKGNRNLPNLMVMTVWNDEYTPEGAVMELEPLADGAATNKMEG